MVDSKLPRVQGKLRATDGGWRLAPEDTPREEIALDVQAVQDSAALADGNLVTVIGTLQSSRGGNGHSAGRLVVSAIVSQQAVLDWATRLGHDVAPSKALREQAEQELLDGTPLRMFGRLEITAHGVLLCEGNVPGSLPVKLPEGAAITEQALHDTVTALGHLHETRLVVGDQQHFVELLADKVVTHEALAERAYEIAAAGSNGSPTENWLRAERELLN